MSEKHIPGRDRRTLYILAGACAVVLIATTVFDYSRPPVDFISNSIVHVGKDATLSGIGSELSDDQVIRSSLFFRIVVTILGDRTSVEAGDYLFKNPENIWQVVYRLVHDKQGIPPVRVTFPEGTTVRNMATILAAAIDVGSTSTPAPGADPAFTFDEKGFLLLASTSEGYLFPDTYLFLPNETPTDIITTMKDTFEAEIGPLAQDIVTFQVFSPIKSYPRTLGNIVIMASILEKEATSTADRRIIAGILWKRLDAGEPLQVDAPFFYLLGKTSAELTLTDLATTSPYNTYVHKGLPPTPIGNPGLDALTDAVMPTNTTYWYYISDKTGMIHYAATYAGQEANVAKYIK